MRILALVLLVTSCAANRTGPRAPVAAPNRTGPRAPAAAPSPTGAPTATLTTIACRLAKPSPTPELSWMKQPVADWLRSLPRTAPPYCSGTGMPTARDPAFEAWFADAIRTLARIPCAELDARLITFRGAGFGTGARISRRALPPTGTGKNACYPTEGPSLTFGVDAAGAVTCVVPMIDDGTEVICLG